MAEKMEYEVKAGDLEKCFEFSVGYYFGVSGGEYNRTTGQFRGLGGIIDSFFVGKLIEIGVASIIENFAKKKMVLDFEIHGPTDDPDIIEVNDSSSRKPNLYVETKNVSSDDRWIGLTSEQFNTIERSRITNGDLKRAFIIFASLFSEKEAKNSDLLGVYLKSKTKDKTFYTFCNPEDLHVKIQYILRMDELKEKGVEFKEGSFLYETDIFKPVEGFLKNIILSPSSRRVYSKISVENNIIPLFMRDMMPEPKEFGNFEYEGDAEIFLKQNRKSFRLYIYCKSDVKVKNKVLGTFNLEKGKLYECFFTTVGRNPVLKRNNIWIAQRNLPNVLTSDVKGRLAEIAQNI